MNKLFVALLALALVTAASTASAQDFDGGVAQPDQRGDSSDQAAGDHDGDTEADLEANPFGQRLAAEGPEDAGELVYSQRGITLPAGTLRADATLGVGRTANVITGAFETSTFLSLGAAFTDNLEIGVSRYRQGAMSDGARLGLLPFQLTKDFNFGVVTPYARFRFLHDERLQLAAELTLILPTATGSDFGVMFGVPFRLMLARMVAIDTGLFFRAIFANKTNSDLVLPVGVIVNVLPQLFLLARLNFTYTDFKDRVLGAELGAGGTIEGDDGPMLDILATFGFPSLLVNGHGFSDPWQVNVTVAYRLGL